MGGLKLQNGFRRRRNPHYGIATILAIAALFEVLIRNNGTSMKQAGPAHQGQSPFLPKPKPNLFTEIKLLCC